MEYNGADPAQRDDGQARPTRDGQLSAKRTFKLIEDCPPDKGPSNTYHSESIASGNADLHCFTGAIRCDFCNGAARPTVRTALGHTAPAFAAVARVIVESPLAIRTRLQTRPLARCDGICHYGHDITNKARFRRFDNQLRSATYPSGFHTECSAIEPLIQGLVTGSFSLACTAQIST